MAISAQVKRRYNEDSTSHQFADPDDFNLEMQKLLGENRDKDVRTSKNKFQRRLNSTTKESEYYYDPKTGRRVRVCDSVWSPTRRDKSKFRFAENSVPHGEN